MLSLLLHEYEAELRTSVIKMITYECSVAPIPMFLICVTLCSKWSPHLSCDHCSGSILLTRVPRPGMIDFTCFGISKA